MFMKKFGIKGRRTKLFAEKRFSEVHNHFLKFGTVTDHRSKKSEEPHWLKSWLFYPKKMTSALNSTFYNLHLKPCKYHRCQQLTEAHMQQRLEFCCWVLDGNIEPKNIIFMDEMWFDLRSSFNCQNTRYWSIQNPHVYDDSVNQGGKKDHGLDRYRWWARLTGRLTWLFWKKK